MTTSLDKVTNKLTEEKKGRDALNEKYLALVEKERAYYKAAKEFQVRRQRRSAKIGARNTATHNTTPRHTQQPHIETRNTHLDQAFSAGPQDECKKNELLTEKLGGTAAAPSSDGMN